MRALQRNVWLRVLLATGASALLTLGAWRAGPLALVVVLFLALLVVVFAALTIAPDAIALRRGHRWRWWWRTSADDGPFWPGTRIPRTPRRPRR